MNNPILTIRNVLLVCVFLASSPALFAVEIPEDPSQSIVYWKPHIIAPEKNRQVARAQQIFNTLLRTWDGTRIAPALHVVKSSSGPWAASLADGNILLSVDALDRCMSYGKERAAHLLAFVLSHEIAHQRADDLWHQKFFRLIGQQRPEQKKALLRGLDNDWINDVAEKEAQADHDAILIMSTVGYDPYQIVDKKDFFTAWVEQIWRNSCAGISNHDPAYDACQQARSRRLRTQAQLKTLSNQTVVYELGLQAFVSGDYRQARQLFTAYGRELPSRAVYTSIALSYLAEALALTPASAPQLYYPLLLDSDPVDAVANHGSDKRGNPQVAKKRRQLIDQAIQHIEKAMKLAPDYRRNYLYLAMSYLLNQNTYMARGILQGQYQQRFGEDAGFNLVLALTLATEGKRAEALTLLQQPLAGIADNTFPASLLRYAVARNQALLEKNPAQRAKIWKNLAQHAKLAGDSELFQRAIKQLRPKQRAGLKLDEYPRIMDHRPGDHLQTALAGQLRSDFWIEGEQQHLVRLPSNGARIVVDASNAISNIWQTGSTQASIARLHIGDEQLRALQVFGTADRELHFSRGTYLAYDRYGLGIHLLNGQVAGWFLYTGQTH